MGFSILMFITEEFKGELGLYLLINACYSLPCCKGALWGSLGCGILFSGSAAIRQCEFEGSVSATPTSVLADMHSC